MPMDLYETRRRLCAELEALSDENGEEEFNAREEELIRQIEELDRQIGVPTTHKECLEIAMGPLRDADARGDENEQRRLTQMIERGKALRAELGPSSLRKPATEPRKPRGKSRRK